MKIVKCRVGIIDFNAFLDVEENINQVFEIWDETPLLERGINGIRVYEYDAPEGWIVEVGQSVLFEKDWSSGDTATRFQIKDGNGNWGMIL